MNTVCVGIIVDTPENLKRLKKTVDFLARFGIVSHIFVVNGQRLNSECHAFIVQLERRSAGLLIVGSSTGQLPGMTAARTLLPVIGLPIAAEMSAAVDLLMTMTNMPLGVAITVIGPNQYENAGLYALQILAGSNPDLHSQLATYREKSV